MKKILQLLVILFVTSAGLFGQVFYDGFTGTGNIGGNVGAVGSTSNNWTTHSVTTGQTTTIDIQSLSLDYMGLQASTGNKIMIPGTNSIVSRDVNSPVTVAGTVAYYSALIDIVDNTQLGANYDYFMCLGQTAGNAVTILPGRLGIKAVSTTNYQLGLLNTSTGTLVYSDWTSTMSFGTTYLVVVKVDISTSPITATLWVNPATLGGAEPVGGVSNTSGTGTVSEFKSICIRNGSGTPKAYIDEIRVGATFADVTPVASSDPSVIVSETSLPDFGSIIEGTVGASESSFTVKGLNLTNDIVITAPAGFDISTLSGESFVATSPVTLSPVAGTVGITTIYVKFHPDAEKAFSDNITITCSDVTPDNAVAVTGTGISSDFTAPAFIETYPNASLISYTSFKVNVDVDEAGKVWFLVVDKDAAAPTSEDVKTTGTLITADAANTEYSASVTDLTNNTSYDVYFVTEDNQSIPNLLPEPVKITVTTLEIASVSIHDIQFTEDASGDSPYVGQVVTTSGIVTAIKGGTAPQPFYIQNGTDPYNGLYVYTFAYPVALGDSVVVTGTPKEYSKLTEMDPVANVSIISSGHPVPEPIVLTTLGAMVEGYEGMLVKVKQATCSSGGSGSYIVNDGSADLTVYKGIYTGLTLSISSVYDITGEMSQYNALYELNPLDATSIKSTNASVSSDFYAVDYLAGTISDVPEADDLATFISKLTAATGSSFGVFDADGFTPATVLDNTKLVIVTTDDMSTSKTYTIIITMYVPSTVASLTKIMVNGTAVNGFLSSKLTYAVLLPVGTSDVPVVTYTLTDDKASAEVTNATDLFGTEAERTTTIVVTAEDNTTTKTYTVVFTVDNTGVINNGAAKLNMYPVPAVDEVTVTGLANVNRLEIMDITGKVLRNIEITGNEVVLNVSNLHKGMYFLRTESQTLKFIKK